jgi:hypothetical protein
MALVEHEQFNLLMYLILARETHHVSLVEHEQFNVLKFLSLT